LFWLNFKGAKPVHIFQGLKTLDSEEPLFLSASDDFDFSQPVSNYAASAGPQCAPGQCGPANSPYRQYCDGLDHRERYEGQLASLMTERFHLRPRVCTVVVGVGNAA
jgi:hypothetical protein